ncbi:MAG: mechanosensitive ion channel family protein, partial [Bacteroidota bacterium]
LLVMPVLGIPISGIVAFGGGSAIVVGIAAHQILANYFGGVLIYSDRHFRVGDWIYSPDKEIEGTVENIGWRATQIRTFDKRPLYVPNAAFSSIIVVNASRMTNRRIKETVGIRYEDAKVLDPITKDIRAMLQGHPGIDQRQTLLVHFTEFAPSSLNINIYTFTKTQDWKAYLDVQQDVFLKIIDIVNQHGASMAFPTRTILLDSEEKLRR